MNGSTFRARSGRQGAKVDQRAHAPEAVEPVEHFLGQERRERLDDRARRGEVARRALDRRALTVGVGGVAAARLHEQPDAQAAQFGRLDAPVERLRRQARCSRARRACDSVAIISAASATRARQRPGDAADIGRIDRHAPGARLQPE